MNFETWRQDDTRRSIDISDALSELRLLLMFCSMSASNATVDGIWFSEPQHGDYVNVGTVQSIRISTAPQLEVTASRM